MEFNFFKLEVYIPEDYFIQLRDALNDKEILTIGDYDNCIATTLVDGYFRPLNGANPFIGNVGEVEKVNELKVEFRCNQEQLKQAVEIIQAIHPYEEPVFHIIPTINHKNL